MTPLMWGSPVRLVASAWTAPSFAGVVIGCVVWTTTSAVSPAAAGKRCESRVWARADAEFPELNLLAYLDPTTCERTEMAMRPTTQSTRTRRRRV
jgi:hypothetical protein